MARPKTQSLILFFILWSPMSQACLFCLEDHDEEEHHTLAVDEKDQVILKLREEVEELKESQLILIKRMNQMRMRLMAYRAKENEGE